MSINQVDLDLPEDEDVNTTPVASAPIAIDELTLTFLRDLPGFRGARHFSLEPLEAGGAFARLTCKDSVRLATGDTIEELTLFVMSPGLLWRHYEVAVDDDLVEELDLSEAGDAALLVIVHPHEPLSKSTANLYSPIVLNRRNGRADQIVPSVSEDAVGWSVRTPFPRESAE